MMYIKELVQLAEDRKVKISDIVKEIESKQLGISEKELFDKMKNYYEVMKKSIKEGIFQPVDSISGITGKEGSKLWEASNAIVGTTVKKAAARAMAVANVNASMGKIVASPTAGSCGIIPGALITVQESLNKSNEDAINSLFTAGAVGEVIAKNATLAGAEGGCQAECGSASAMAAAAIVELIGGSPIQVSHAVAIALKSVMGLVCDPVAGLVEVPCVKRNAMGAVQALLSADMVMAGIESVIPADEVIKAMSEVGHMMPEQLKETALGGIATTPTGKEIKKRIFGKKKLKQRRCYFGAKTEKNSCFR